MEIITKANDGILQILKRYQKTVSDVRLMKYCIQTPVEDGVLLLNVLTREMVKLTWAEYEHMGNIREMKDRWFLVPVDTNEKELVDLVRWVLETRRKEPEYITQYTIFPTTDCNARCFYCFELGRSRVPMSEETAHKVVRYIKEHCGGKKVHISWFGGEPLFNQSAIDSICDGLCREGIEFTSSAVSNGYLFDAQTVNKAVERWNLKRVQISLDGTEQVYNRAKAYIYREGSPYQVVLENMGRLLNAQVGIAVRLNMDLYNANDLLTLVEELAHRFEGKKGLQIYAHHLFDGNRPMAESHTDEEWDLRDEAMRSLEAAIEGYGLVGKAGISKNIKLNHCMADSGSAVTITPNGDIGLCEHFSEDQFIGHIDSAGFDTAKIRDWKEKAREHPDCIDCAHYPDCVMLKNCPNTGLCFRQLRQEKLRKVERQMLNEYNMWKNRETAEQAEEDATC